MEHLWIGYIMEFGKRIENVWQKGFFCNIYCKEHVYDYQRKCFKWIY